MSIIFCSVPLLTQAPSEAPLLGAQKQMAVLKIRHKSFHPFPEIPVIVKHRSVFIPFKAASRRQRNHPGSAVMENLVFIASISIPIFQMQYQNIFRPVQFSPIDVVPACPRLMGALRKKNLPCASRKRMIPLSPSPILPL